MPAPTKQTHRAFKIGLVLDDSLDKVDGVQQYVIGVGEWLRAHGHEVHYLVGETTRRDLPNVHSLSRNLKVRFNGNRMSMPLPTSRTKLRQLLAAEQFDVLHVQLPHSPYLAHRLVLEAGDRTAVVGTFHIIGYGKLVTVATKALGIWTRKSLERFDTMVSVTDAAGRFAHDAFGIETIVLPLMIDYQLFHTAKRLPKYNDDRLTILFLGRLVPRKGCQVLLEAIEYLVQDSGLPQFRVVICGKGPLAPRLQRFTADRGLSGLVEFVGFVSEKDKPRYYASADITVFPSLGGESFGIVLLEGMASGHAVVLAGDNPGYRSVMTTRPELLFNPRNARDLAHKLAQYMTNSKLRSAAQNWGMQYTAGFDNDKVGEELVDMYRQALRKRAEQ